MCGAPAGHAPTRPILARPHYLELFDSLSGDIVGRAADRRGARSSSFATVSNRVTNRADARREFRVWADKLIEFLNEHYVEANVATE